MKKILSMLFLSGGIVMSSGAHDAVPVVQYAGIIAVVNGSIITAEDLNEHMRIAMLTMGLQDNLENRKEVLKSIITEKLKWNLLNKMFQNQQIISDKEVDAAFKQMAENNHMLVAEFSKLLASKKINIKVFKHSIRVNLAWIEYIKLRYGKNVKVTESELERTLANIEKQRKEESFFVSRMFFPIIDASEIESVRLRVNNIRNMIANGSKFESLARKFSKSPDAKNGGDLGWVYEGQLSKEEYNAVKSMSVGQVKVVQNSRGFYILQLKDKKEAGKDSITHIQFVQVGIPLSKYAGGQDTYGLITQLKQTYPNSNAFIKQAKTLGLFVSEPVTGVLDGMVHKLRNVLAVCPVNGLSRIVNNDRGHFVFCVLSKRQQKIPRPTKEDIKGQKLNEKFGIFSDKELYEIKKKAEIKLDSKYGKSSDFISQL